MKKLMIVLVAVLLALSPAPAATSQRIPTTPADLVWIVVTTPGAVQVVTLELPADRYPDLYRHAETIDRPGMDHRFTVAP